MSLSDQQFEFAKDVALLIQFIERKGWKVTLGEAWRTQEQQDIYLAEGKTTVNYSQHQKRLAIDLNFFTPSGDYVVSKQKLQEFGNFWESLNERNQWGGNWDDFQDTPHFERNV